MASPPAPRPVSDSPWFWAYLFGTAALVALALAGGKYGPRQAQIEREFQGRQRAAQHLNDVTPDVEMSTAQRTLITLRPLFIALAAVTLVAWIVFWRTRMRGGRYGRPSDRSAVTTGKAPSS